MSNINESIIEDAALTWFGELGYAIVHGLRMALAVEPCHAIPHHPTRHAAAEAAERGVKRRGDRKTRRANRNLLI